MMTPALARASAPVSKFAVFDSFGSRELDPAPSVDDDVREEAAT